MSIMPIQLTMSALLSLPTWLKYYPRMTITSSQSQSLARPPKSQFGFRVWNFPVSISIQRRSLRATTEPMALLDVNFALKTENVAGSSF